MQALIFFISLFVFSTTSSAQSADDLTWVIEQNLPNTDCKNTSGRLSSTFCPNGFRFAQINIAEYGSGTRMTVSFLASMIASDAAFMYRVTLPVGVQVYAIGVRNSTTPKSKVESETAFLGMSNIISEEIKAGLLDIAKLDGIALAIKLFFAGNYQAGGSAEYLVEYQPTTILDKRYYPYSHYQGIFARRDTRLTTDLDIYMNRPLKDVLRYLRVQKASFYIGQSPSNELLIEGLRYNYQVP